MVRKLEVAVSNSIMEDIPVSFSLSVSVPFLLFLVHVLFLSFLLIPHFSCYYVADSFDFRIQKRDKEVAP